jgi:hypothetical protein
MNNIPVTKDAKQWRKWGSIPVTRAIVSFPDKSVTCCRKHRGRKRHQLVGSDYQQALENPDPKRVEFWTLYFTQVGHGITKDNSSTPTSHGKPSQERVQSISKTNINQHETRQGLPRKCR